MGKIKAKAIPVTEKTYPCLMGILMQADCASSYRSSFDFSPEWTGSVVCLDELGISSLDDIEVENDLGSEPYFLEIDGNLLVRDWSPRTCAYCFPCMVNAKGYEFSDSYVTPSEEEYLCRIIIEEEFEANGAIFLRDSTTTNPDYGAYFVRCEGNFEMWDAFSSWLYYYSAGNGRFSQKLEEVIR